MSTTQKGWQWLHSELPILIEKNIISPETADRFKSYYGALPKQAALPMALIITGILGAILIGMGIILIFGVNWEHFSQTQRTILSFLPLVVAQIAYGYAFFKKNNSISWVESTSVFLMLMLASTLALISQTYHIDGHLEDFLFTWLILSIPLMYLLNATLPALLFMSISCWWAGLVVDNSNTELIYYWIFFLAVLPHLWYNLNDFKTGIRQVISGWVFVVTFTISMTIVLYTKHVEEHYIIAIAILPIFIYLLGKYIYASGKSIWRRPFQTSAITFILFIALGLAYGADVDFDFQNKIMDGYFKNGLTGIIKFVFIILCLAGLLTLAGLRLKQKKQTNLLLLIFPILMFLVLLFPPTGNTIMFNLFLLAFSIYYIRDGLKYQKLSLINTGMLVISMLIGMRFFDSSISFLVKGIVFIFIGVCFLTANIYLSWQYKIDEQ